MKILCVNAGSSSLKFQLYEMPEEKVLINGYIEKIGLEDSFYTIKINGEKIKKVKLINNHTEAVGVLIDELFLNKVIYSLEEIKAVIKSIQPKARIIETNYSKVSIDDISEEAFVSEDTFDVIEDERDFVFENEWLHNAYLELPKEKQRLLVLLFIEEKDAKEIAQILGCSQRYVYKQRAAIFDFIRERKERTNG